MTSVYPYIRVVPAGKWSIFLSKNQNMSLGCHPWSDVGGLEYGSQDIHVSHIINYFKNDFKYIFEKCSLDELFFLCGIDHTYRFSFIVDSMASIIHEEEIFFTVIDINTDKVLSQIDVLFEWCGNNPIELINILDVHETKEDILFSIKSSDSMLKINREKFNKKTKSSKLFFDFFFTIKELLISARASHDLFIYQISYVYK